MGNILDSFKGLISDEVLSGAAGALGENKDALSGAFEGAIPSILGGLLKSDPAGHSNLGGLFGQAANNSGLVGDLLGGLTGGGNSGGMMDSIIKGILGDKLGGIVNIITKVSGIKSGSSSSVMGIAGSLLASFLGKKMAKDGMNFGGMLDWLKGGQDDIVKAAPAGIADLLGFGSGPVGTAGNVVKGAAGAVTGAAGKVVDGVGNVAGGAVDAAGKVVGGAGNAVKGAAGAVTGAAGKVAGGVGNVAGGAMDAAGGAVKAGGGLIRRILPLALIALLGLGAWYFLKGCGNGEGIAGAAGDAVSGVTETVGDVAEGAGDIAEGAVGAVAGALNDAGDWVADLGGDVELKMPDGTMLASQEGSIANKLFQFATDADAVPNKDKAENWFNFEKVFFESGSATMKPGAEDVIKNAVAVLGAYPDMKIKVAGYTDNDGSAEGNLKLSDSRAQTLYNTLINAGAARTSFDAEKPYEGYGVEYPACPANDSPECKAQNRRCAAVVTAK